MVLAAGDSQSLAGLQLYGVLAHSSIAGLLLMTGIAASHKRLLRGCCAQRAPPNYRQNRCNCATKRTAHAQQIDTANAGKSSNSDAHCSVDLLSVWLSAGAKEDNSHRRQQETDLLSSVGFLKVGFHLSLPP